MLGGELTIEVRPDWSSLRVRKRIEEIFGWLKAVALMRKQRHRGLPRVRWLLIFAVAPYTGISDMDRFPAPRPSTEPTVPSVSSFILPAR